MPWIEPISSPIVGTLRPLHRARLEGPGGRRLPPPPPPPLPQWPACLAQPLPAAAPQWHSWEIPGTPGDPPCRLALAQPAAAQVTLLFGRWPQMTTACPFLGPSSLSRVFPCGAAFHQPHWGLWASHHGVPEPCASPGLWADGVGTSITAGQQLPRNNGVSRTLWPGPARWRVSDLSSANLF